jgi:hypothetical protein
MLTVATLTDKPWYMYKTRRGKLTAMLSWIGDYHGIENAVGMVLYRIESAGAGSPLSTSYMIIW